MKVCGILNWKCIVSTFLSLASMCDALFPNHNPYDCCLHPIYTSLISNFVGNMIVGFKTKNIIIYYDQDLLSSLVTNLTFRAVLAGTTLEILRYLRLLLNYVLYETKSLRIRF